MTEFTENINWLREKYPDKDDQEHIDEWEKNMRIIVAREDYANHEITQKIIAIAKENFVHSSYVLGTSRNLTEEDRTRLWNIKDSSEWYLNLVVADFEGLKEQLSSEVRTRMN